MKKQYSAFDVYGGKESVLERMELLARDRLNSMPNKHKAHMYKELREEKNTDRIIEFLNGKRSIDYTTFEMLSNSYLEMNIHDVLGEPDLGNLDVRRYWENQMKVKPMVICGNTPKNPVNKDAELRFYVKLRVINELAHAA